MTTSIRLAETLAGTPLIALLLAVLLSVALPGPTRAQDSVSPPWVVFQLTGEVRVRAPSADAAAQPWRRLEQGARLTTASEIDTGPDGRVSLTRGDDVMHVMPGSRIAIPAPPRGSILTRIRLFVGKVFFGVEARPGRRFEVETPHLAAIVKGTSFSVAATPALAEVAVAEGVVGVTALADGQSVDIRPGQAARLSSAPGSALSVRPFGPGGFNDPAPPATDGDAPGGGGGPGDAPAGGPGERPGGAPGEQRDGRAPDEGQSPGSSGSAPGRTKKASAGAGSPGPVVIGRPLGGLSVDVAGVTGGLVHGGDGKPAGTAGGGATNGAAASGTGIGTIVSQSNAQAPRGGSGADNNGNGGGPGNGNGGPENGNGGGPGNGNGGGPGNGNGGGPGNGNGGGPGNGNGGGKGKGNNGNGNGG